VGVVGQLFGLSNKGGFGMNWMPCAETYANIAYNLFLAMKLLASPPCYRTSSISTARWCYEIAYG